MHSELSGHEGERRALLVPRRGEGNRLVGHLADHRPSSDTSLVELVDDRRPVDLVPARKCIDRRAVSIEADQCIDLGSQQIFTV